jgi:clan AA aspartic protease (TIGR02281 family)
MLRNYVIIILALGIFGAMAGRFHSGPSPASAKPDYAQRAFDDEASRIAELKAKNTPQFNSQDGSLELQRGPDGHFYADVRINGSSVHMLVDTGASIIALSRNDAQMAGIATSIGMNDVVGRGADGEVHGEVVRLDNVELGPLSAQGLDAIVLNSGEQSLLGQSFLSQFSSVEIQGDRMILRQRT